MLSYLTNVHGERLKLALVGAIVLAALVWALVWGVTHFLSYTDADAMNSRACAAGISSACNYAAGEVPG